MDCDVEGWVPESGEGKSRTERSTGGIEDGGFIIVGALKSICIAGRNSSSKSSDVS